MQYNPDCFPKYECGEWSSCVSGLNSRVCQDKICGRREITERKICGEEIGCKPDVKCGEWSQCDYSEKVEDLLHGKISFGGFEERTCADSSGCVENFIQEEPCQDEYALGLQKKNFCGVDYLSVIDNSSGREVARIDLDSWETNKLNIALTDGKAQYCDSCFNGVKDENEVDIDCGRACSPCKEKNKISTDIVVQGGLWASAFIFFIVVIYELLLNRSQKNKEATA